MSLRINSNFAAISDGALRSQHSYQNKMGKAITRVSTGKRVNTAADDVVAYNASKRIRSDAVGYNALNQSIQNSSVYLQAADTASAQVVDTVTAIREKYIAYQALSDTDKGGAAGEALDKEFKTLQTELKAMVNNFGLAHNDSLLKADNTFTFTVDFNAVGNTYTVSWSSISGLAGMSSAMNGVISNSSLGSELKSALDKVTKEAAKIGAGVSTLETLSEYLDNMAALQEQAYSDLTEVDMAKEMTAYVKNNIYSQASQAMIAQANQSLAQVLNLLQ